MVALWMRARYPMDLEWLEGPQLYEAFRFAHGLPVFGPPSQGFVPSPYPPLFHWVVSLIGRGFGFDYWNGRLVSDASIAVVMALGAVAVLRAAPSRKLGAVLALMGAAGVAAAYRPLEASMDLARVDMMGFALAGIAAALAQRPPLLVPRAVSLGVVMCAAIYTKQTNVFYAAWISLYVASRDRRGAAIAVGVATALALPPFLVLQGSSRGWFLTWMTVMRHHPIVLGRCVVASTVLLATAAAFLCAGLALHRRGFLREPSWFWAGMLVAAVPASVAPWLTEGGWVNNLIGVAMVALLLSLLLVGDALSGIAATTPSHVSLRMQRGFVGLLSALLVGALYDPMLNVPDAEHRRDAESLHARVRGLDGDVLIPMYPFVAARDGKTTPQVALLASLDSDGKGGLDLDVAGSIRDKHPRFLVLFGHPQENRLRTWLGRGYASVALDLSVSALKETTRREVTLLERTEMAAP
jgi:hypothetical protein